MPSPILKTERLVLRHWKEGDLPLFAKLNADPRVMEFFPSTLSSEESDDFAKNIEAELQEKAYGLWAAEVSKQKKFIGFIGLHHQNFSAHFTPCVEIGWRLAFDMWGQGFAFEGASKVLEYAFETLELDEVVSFTAASNYRSRKLMEKLGMTRDPVDDFLHPKLPKGHPLRSHVLYRLQKCAYA